MEIASNGRCYSDFVNSIKSPQTKKSYVQNLSRFIKFCKLDSVDELLKIDMQKAIIDYVVSLKESKLSHSTIHVLLAPIYHFCEMSEIVINKARITKFKGEKVRVVKDRIYSRQELQSLADNCELRVKVCILLMTGSGLRVGSVPNLRLRNLQKVKDNIYKVTVYENSVDEYFTFCTPECSKAIDDYLEYRKTNFEVLRPDSYLIINQFNINKRIKPKPIAVDTLRGLINRVTKKVGLRKTNHSGNSRERKDVMLTHNFRKWYSSQLAESNVQTEWRWLLEGHNLKGNDSSYVRVSEKRLLEEYTKAIDALTIDPANRLQRKVEVLEAEKSKMELLEIKYEKDKKEMDEKLSKIIAAMQKNPSLFKIKPEVLKRKIK